MTEEEEQQQRKREEQITRTEQKLLDFCNEIIAKNLYNIANKELKLKPNKSIIKQDDYDDTLYWQMTKSRYNGNHIMIKLYGVNDELEENEFAICSVYKQLPDNQTIYGKIIKLDGYVFVITKFKTIKPNNYTELK
jgi:ribosomal protein L35AE/L33A